MWKQPRANPVGIIDRVPAERTSIERANAYHSRSGFLTAAKPPQCLHCDSSELRQLRRYRYVAWAHFGILNSGNPQSFQISRAFIMRAPSVCSCIATHRGRDALLLSASSVACAGLQSRQLHADVGSAGGGQAVVADQPTGGACLNDEEKGRIGGSKRRLGLRGRWNRREHRAAHLWLPGNPVVCYRPRRFRVHLGNVGISLLLRQ
jgi:hypothetical protein